MSVNFNTEIISVDPLHPNAELIEIAADWIKKGEVVAFPTETVYGLGADATKDAAVRKIYAAKKRPADNPLIAHFADTEDLYSYAEKIPGLAYQLADRFWPGPLTLVLEKGENISPVVTKGLDTIAVRIPAHQVALSLIEASGVPIAAPSANLSGKPSPTNSTHVATDLSGVIPIILNGGTTSIGVESTVVNLTETPPVLLRPGGITIEELQEFIPDIIIPKSDVQIQKPLSPGMKYTHYSPEKELVLIQDPGLDWPQIDGYSRSVSKRSLILCTHSRHKHKEDHLVIGDSLKEIQVNIFAALRLLDAGSYELGLIEAVEERNEGFTIMNRLRKAAHKIL